MAIEFGSEIEIMMPDLQYRITEHSVCEWGGGIVTNGFQKNSKLFFLTKWDIKYNLQNFSI